MVSFLSTIVNVVIGILLLTIGTSYLQNYLKPHGYCITIINFKILIGSIYFIFAFIFLSFAYGDFGSIFACIFLALGILVTCSDIFVYKIPNLFSLLAFSTSIVSTVFLCISNKSLKFFYNFLIVLCILILFSFIFIFLAKNIGMGDIKLYFGYLLWIGSFNPYFALYAFSLSGFLLLFYVLLVRKSLNDMNPFAPFIVSSTLIIWLILVSNTYSFSNIVTH